MKFVFLSCILIILTISVDCRRIARQSEDGEIEGVDDRWWIFGNRRTTTTTTTTTTQRSAQNLNARVQGCIRTCPVTPEYNPVCGILDQQYQQYNNIGSMNCARRCGVAVELAFNGACTPLT